MKALVYHGPGQPSWEQVPDPTVREPTDVVVRVDASTICGTDLHILRGDVPTVAKGRVLGHEAVGTVVAAGTAVAGLAEGDRVLVPAISSCGRCANCRRAMPSHCLALGGIGWVLGHLVDGLQAEYARVPFAETSLHRLPDEVTDIQALFLADILPTGYEVGVRNGRVGPGDTVAVVGAGPVGLSAIMTAGLHGAGRIVAVDVLDSRLEFATRFGATHTVRGTAEDVEARVAELTDGHGVDVAIEAVGTPGTFETCVRLVRPGGVVANVGVHGAPATLHLEDLWIKNVTITTGLVDTVSVPMLLRLVRDGRLDAARFGTHRFRFDEIPRAYEVFGDAGRHRALKVVLTP